MIAQASFLRDSAVIDWRHPAIRSLARELSWGRGPFGIVRACFEWVRDRVAHTVDHGLDQVTCTASEVLRERNGFCYAKSHLLAALLRANGVPAGFVYQRLALDARVTAFCLHGLNAVWLPHVGWYRLDPRGDRADLRADFDPPREVLPYACRVPGDRLFDGIWAEPLSMVVDALRRYRARRDLEAHLPDATDLDQRSLTGGGATLVATHRS